ncbi:MAG TPA: CBS domain-containing protein [Anditalea sp.]|nr:CBS domain-containing protein [Anditalea sp.]
MEKSTPISSIMTSVVQTVEESASLHEVISILRKYKIRHVPVINSGKVVGMISRTDINRLTFGALFEDQEDADDTIIASLSVSQVMTSKLKYISPSDTIKDVAKIFAKEEFHALPVLDQGELKGIVTTTDVISYMLKQY